MLLGRSGCSSRQGKGIEIDNLSSFSMQNLQTLFLSLNQKEKSSIPFILSKVFENYQFITQVKSKKFYCYFLNFNYAFKITYQGQIFLLDSPMLSSILKSLMKGSSVPQPSIPIPSQISKIRRYSSGTRKILKWEDGTFYDGECVNGMILEGKGKLCFPNGQFYQGEFEENQFSGVGRYTNADGSYYDGEWKNDVKNGHGKQVYADGSAYNGEFRNGMKNGTGILEMNDGSFYEGQFVNDKFQGMGKMTYAGGSLYYGEWKNNKKQGKGELGEKESIFIGSFKEGLRNGSGLQIDKKTEIKIEGVWVDDILGRYLIYEKCKVRSAKNIEEKVIYLTDQEYHLEQKNDQ